MRSKKEFLREIRKAASALGDLEPVWLDELAQSAIVEEDNLSEECAFHSSMLLLWWLRYEEYRACLEDIDAEISSGIADFIEREVESARDMDERVPQITELKARSLSCPSVISLTEKKLRIQKVERILRRIGEAMTARGNMLMVLSGRQRALAEQARLDP